MLAKFTKNDGSKVVVREVGTQHVVTCFGFMKPISTSESALLKGGYTGKATSWCPSAEEAAQMASYMESHTLGLREYTLKRGDYQRKLSAIEAKAWNCLYKPSAKVSEGSEVWVKSDCEINLVRIKLLPKESRGGSGGGTVVEGADASSTAAATTEGTDDTFE